MKVYVVSVQQFFANHFYVDRVFGTRKAAERYIAEKKLSSAVIDECKVENDAEEHNE